MFMSSPAASARHAGSESIGSLATTTSGRSTPAPEWTRLPRLLECSSGAPGELVHVDDGLQVSAHALLRDAPAHPLTIGDLGAHAKASQASTSP